jgi:PKD repeat protein
VTSSLITATAIIPLSVAQSSWQISTNKQIYKYGETVVFIVTKPSGYGSCGQAPSVTVTLPDGSVNTIILPIENMIPAGTYQISAGQAGPPPGSRLAQLWIGPICDVPSSKHSVISSTTYYVQESSTTRSLTVSISANLTSGQAPLSVSFSGSVTGGTGSYTEYAWDFGDGSTGSGSSISHTYSAPGTYTTKLTVTDSSGSQASTVTTITVSPPCQYGGTYPNCNAPPNVRLRESPYFEDKLPSCSSGSLLSCLDALAVVGGIKDIAVNGVFHATLDPSSLVRTAQVEVVEDYVTVSDGTVQHETKDYSLQPTGSDFEAPIQINTWWPAQAADWAVSLLEFRVMTSPSDKYTDIVNNIQGMAQYDLPEVKVGFGFERIYTGARVIGISGVDMNGRSFNIPLDQQLQLNTAYQNLARAAQGSDFFGTQVASPVALSIADDSGRRMGAFQNNIYHDIPNAYYVGEPGTPQLIIVGSTGRFLIEVQGLRDGTYTLRTLTRNRGSSNENTVANQATIRSGDDIKYNVDLPGGNLTPVIEAQTESGATSAYILGLFAIAPMAVFIAAVAVYFGRRSTRRTSLGRPGFCLRCGTPIRQDDRFCLRCGTPTRKRIVITP